MKGISYIILRYTSSMTYSKDNKILFKIILQFKLNPSILNLIFSRFINIFNSATYSLFMVLYRVQSFSFIGCSGVLYNAPVVHHRSWCDLCRYGLRFFCLSRNLFHLTFFRIFIAVMHLRFICCVCGFYVSFVSRKTPRNFDLLTCFIWCWSNNSLIAQVISRFHAKFIIIIFVVDNLSSCFPPHCSSFPVTSWPAYILLGRRDIACIWLVS